MNNKVVNDKAQANIFCPFEIMKDPFKKLYLWGKCFQKMTYFIAEIQKGRWDKAVNGCATLFKMTFRRRVSKKKRDLVQICSVLENKTNSVCLFS